MADGQMDIYSPEHFKALAHPTRQRLLFALDQPATVSQLAVTIGSHKGNIAHHLKVLREAGLIVSAGLVCLAAANRTTPEAVLDILPPWFRVKARWHNDRWLPSSLL